MQSLSKTKISKELARQIMSSHFGDKSALSEFSELTDGFYNAAYMLGMSDGTRYVMKVSPPLNARILRYEKNIMQTEVEVMRLVRGQTDIPVPEIYVTDFSHSLVDNDYFIMDFIEGTPLNKLRESLSTEDRRQIDIKTGLFLRQMNAIKSVKFGYFSQPTLQFEHWHEAFDRMLVNVFEDGKAADVELPMDYDSLYAELATSFHTLDEVQEPCLVHWDLWDGNIFVSPETKRITGLIDFERALWADPLMEANFGAFGINPSFMEGYGADMLSSRGQQIRHALYDIYLFLIMIIECYYRKYETDNQEKWSREKLANELEILRSLQSK